MSGDVQLEDVIYTDPTQPNLDMITVKRNPINPIDLLASNRMPLLLTQLRSRYKFIVLDAPPILGITDTKIAMHLADAVLFVVRWGKTKADVAANGVAALRECRAPLAGAVMTQVNMRRHAQAAYGDAVEYTTSTSTTTRTEASAVRRHVREGSGPSLARTRGLPLLRGCIRDDGTASDGCHRPGAGGFPAGLGADRLDHSAGHGQIVRGEGRMDQEHQAGLAELPRHG